MKKILVAILITILIQLTIMPILPVEAEDSSLPPLSPDESWQPPDSGEVIDLPVGVERYSESSSSLQIAPPPSQLPGATGIITTAYLVNSYGQVLTNLYRNETCYLIISFSGPGYFYLWEYYPAGTYSYGHWLCYRWYRPDAGVWKIGPFAAQAGDPAGRYTWKMWYLSGASWSTRSLSFDFNGIYYPPDIPNPIPEPVYYPAINSFSANKSTIDAGETAVLTWTATNASSVTISPDIGTVGASGSTSVTPAVTTTYTLAAKSKSGNTVSSTLTIVVIPRMPPEIGVSLARIQRGKSTAISWNAPGAVNVSIIGIGNVGVQGSMQVSPQETTTYTLNAAYADGATQSAQVTVRVEQPPYLFWGLIALLAVAIAVIVIMLIRRRNKTRQATVAEIKTEHTTQPDTTLAATTLPVTTPLMEAPASRLVMPDGSQILLAGNNRLLGRKDFEDFMPHENITYLSRQHINIWYENGQYYAEDRSSTNGTRVNGVDIRGAGRQALSDGDMIELASKLRMIFKEDINKEVK